MAVSVKEGTEIILDNVNQVMVGKEECVKLLLAALLSGGHVLLEDVPGTGKTKLAKAFAKTISARFSRIQFTPDLLPTDLTGLNIYSAKTGEFALRKGPVFTDILLADEINRATPRTQAGLLECMEERQVTIDGESYPLGNAFFVIATQNPIENAGTFPLPEAQMDRFLMKLSMQLPGRDEEIRILERFKAADPLEDLQAKIRTEDVEAMRKEASNVFVHKSVLGYIADIAAGTRAGEGVVMGVSPRGSLALLHAAKAYACISGRDYCTPDDVKAVAIPVLAHRIILGYGQSQTSDSESFVRKVLDNATVPTEDFKN